MAKMEKVVIGTHNSMTWLKPKSLIMYLLALLFARCQKKHIIDQLNSGARAFDIRIFNKDNTWVFSHGLVNYTRSSYNIYNVMDHLNDFSTLDSPIYVRLLLEKYKTQEDKDKFVCLCELLEKEYPNIIFFGGYLKKPWEKLYTFKNDISENNEVHQWVSSMAEDAKWYEKYLPWLYAKRHNSINKLKVKPGINLFDFI